MEDNNNNNNNHSTSSFLNTSSSSLNIDSETKGSFSPESWPVSPVPSSCSSSGSGIMLNNQSDKEIAQSELPTETVLYENDFDLCTLLTDMVKAKAALAAAVRKTSRKAGAGFKDYTRQLTARLLDSHFTNGRSGWSLEQNGIDLYRSRVKCIGTDVADFEYGQPVFLDLQPLSTRIKGACVERNGSPKLVQDQCIQVEEPTAQASTGDSVASVSRQSSIIKKKSSSCENLLANHQEIEIEKEKVTDAYSEANEDVEINISIFGTGQQEQPSGSFKRKLSRKRSLLGRKISATRNAAGGGALTSSVLSSCCFSDDEFSASASVTTMTSTTGTTKFERPFFKASKFTKIDRDSSLNVSLEHSFKYNLSNSSSNSSSFRETGDEHTSVPYYQYRILREASSNEKGTNTVDNDNKNNNQNLSISSLSDKSTFTDGLLSNYFIGCFSKNQLLSSQSLFKQRSTLTSSYAYICSNNFPHEEVNNMANCQQTGQSTTTAILSSVPAILIRNNELSNNAKACYQRPQLKSRISKKTINNNEELGNGSTNLNRYYKVVGGGGGDYAHSLKESFRLLTSDLQNSNAPRTHKPTPKKSNEWELNINKSDGNGKKSQPLSVITTMLTTTTISTIKTTTKLNDIEERSKVLVKESKEEKATENNGNCSPQATEIMLVSAH